MKRVCLPFKVQFQELQDPHQNYLSFLLTVTVPLLQSSLTTRAGGA